MDTQQRSLVVTGGPSRIGRPPPFDCDRGGRVVIGDVDEAGGRAVAAEGTAQDLAAEFFRST